MPTRLLGALIFCVVLSFTLTLAYGQTVSWNGPYPGYWNTPTNWIPAVLPGPANDVVIYHPNGEDYVYLNPGTATISSLTLGGSSGLPSATLLTGFGFGTGVQNLAILNFLTIGVSGDLELGAGDTVNLGNDINGGSFQNSGRLYVGPGATMLIPDAQTATVVASATFDIQGSFTQQYFNLLTSLQGQLYLQNGQTWSIQPNLGTLTMNVGSSLFVGNGTRLIVNDTDVVNQGFLSTGGTGNNDLEIYGQLTNNFVFQVGNGDLADVFVLANNFAVIVGAGGTLNLAGRYQPGITDIPAGSEFQIFGTFSQTYNGANPSAFYQLTSVEGSLILGNGQTIVDTPTSGTLTIGSTGYVEVKSGTTLTIPLVGGLLGNTVVMPGGKLSTNDLGATTVNIGGTLTNLGQINVFGSQAVLNAGSIVNGGMLSLPEGSKVNVANGFYQLAAGTLGEAIGAGGFSILVDANGQMMLAGTLDVMLDHGFNPAIGTTYEFITFQPGELSGSFASIQNEYFNGTEGWLVIYNNAGGYVGLEAVPSPEPSSLVLLSSGLLSLVYGMRRRWM